MTSMTSKLARGSWTLSLAWIAVVACSPTPPAGMDDGNTTTTYGGSNGSGDATSDGGYPGDVDDGGDGVPGDPTDDGPSDPSDDGDDDGGTSSGPLDIGPDGWPDGSTCTNDWECSSGNCYIIPFLGGICGECNSDADCNDGGCTAPNPFDSSPSVCNLGELGGGCQSDAPCAGDLECSTAFDLLGLIQITTCGACLGNNDCPDGLLCAPVVELSKFSGYNDCIASNSLPNGSYCLLDGGNEACESGHCGVVDVMGLAQLGVCGECSDDQDCPEGSCTPGEFLLDSATLIGSSCQ